ncbi:MAG: MFS transporter [Promethearchaeota archaeon]
MKPFNQKSVQIPILWITYFLWSVSQGFVGPFLNLYIYQASQGDLLLVALITSIPAFSTIISVSFWGWTIDKLNNNKVFAALGLFSAASLYLMGTIITDAFQFFIVFSVLSFFINAYLPASQSYASFQGSRSGQSFANLFAFASIGWFSGAIISGVFYDLLGMLILFQFAFGVLVLAGALSIFGFKRDNNPVLDDFKSETSSSWKKVLSNPVILLICSINGLHNLFAAIVGPYFSIYVKNLGGASYIIGFAVALGTLLGTILLPFFGRLTERLGRRKPFIIYSVGGLTSSAIICFLIPNPLVISFFWAGVPFYPGMLTGAYAMLTDACTERNRGKAVGLYNALAYLGIGIGPFVGAWIVIRWNIATNYLIVGILEFILLLFVILFVKETKIQKDLINLEQAKPQVPSLLPP